MLGALWWFLFFHRCFHLVSAFSEQTFEFSVPEECPLNTLVGKVPLLANASYRTSTSSVIAKQIFSLSRANGEIRTIGALDREQLPAPDEPLDLVVISQPFSLLNVHIHILDVNDNAPQFPLQVYNVSVLESAAPGSRFRLQTARDPDKGENGTVARYVLRSQRPETLGRFKLVRVTDVDAGDSVFLELVDSLDRERQAHYEFELEASDGGNPPLTGSCSVVVTVVDVNDRVPTFARSLFNVSVKATGPVGEVLTTLTAVDEDLGENARITYTLLDDLAGQFSIDAATGKVKRKKSRLRCDASVCPLCPAKICLLHVEASDNGTPRLTGRTFLNLYLSEGNQQAPDIVVKTYPNGTDYLLLGEKTPIGATLAVVTAQDKDGDQTELTLSAGNEDGLFKLESGHNFGILRLAKRVTADHGSIALEFTALDNGVPPLKTTRRINVFVPKADDAQPHFSRNIFRVVLPADLAPDSFVLKLDLVDALQPSFRIKSTVAVPFAVNAATGVVKLTRALTPQDPLRFEFDVEAVSAPPSWKKASTQVVIDVRDSGNSAPRFGDSYLVVQVPEDTPATSKIFHVKCMDFDQGKLAELRYSLSALDKDFLPLRIDSFNGQVFLTEQLDFEQRRNVSFAVVCRDNGEPALQDVLKVTLLVQDVNDNDPVFDQTRLEVNVRAQDPVGTELVQVTARDADLLDEDRLSYYVVNAPLGLIDIDSRTGRVLTKTLLNSVQKAQFPFQVTIGARDSAEHFSSNNAVITVHLIDDVTEVPIFDQTEWIFTIEENTPANHLIATLAASISHRGHVRYSLLLGAPALTIDPATGVLRTSQVFDYEQLQRVDFVVLAATQQAVASRKGSLLITDVNDNPPTFMGQKKFNVSLGSPIGTPIGRLLATDPDNGANGTVRYSCKSNLVAIDPDTGILFTLPLEQEIREQQWQIAIEATDLGTPPLSAQITVVIQLQPATPPVPMPSRVTKVVKGTESEFSVNPVADAQRFTFHPTSNVSALGEFLTDGRVFFHHDAFCPLETVQYKVVDRDRNTSSSLELELIRQESPSASLVCIFNNVLEVQQNTSVGSVFFPSLVENQHEEVLGYRLVNHDPWVLMDSASGGLLLTSPFEENDLKDRLLKVKVYDVRNRHRHTICSVTVRPVNGTGKNLQFKHSFYSKTVDHDFSGAVLNVSVSGDQNIKFALESPSVFFQVDSKTGELTTRRRLRSNYLYNVSILASAAHGTAKTFALIQVRGDPAAVPRIHAVHDITLSEKTRPGSVVTRVSSAAAELPVVFSLTDGNLLSTFEIDPEMGDIVLTRPLDFEKVQRYNLTVTASTNLRNASVHILVNVQNELDNAPTILNSQFVVQENQGPSAVVGPLILQNVEDASPAGFKLEIVYQLPENGRFYITEDDVLMVAENLDRELVSEYRLLLRVSSRKQPEVFSENHVTVTVGDENDNVPECLQTAAFVLSPHTEFPVSFQLACFDRDEGFNASLGYQLISSTDAFAMDWSGVLSVKRMPQESIVHLDAIVSDRTSLETVSKQDELRSSSKLKIVVIRSNPGTVFRSEKSVFVVAPSEVPGSVIGSVPLVDSRSLTFVVAQHPSLDVASFLTLTDGELRVVKPPNHNLSRIHLEVVGMNAESEKTQLHQVDIEIAAKGNNGHFVLPVDFYEFQVNESVRVGAVVGRIQVLHATDNLKFQFHDDKAIPNPFHVDEKTGTVMVSEELDFEKQRVIKTDVTVSSSSLAATVPVYFHLLDTNDNVPVFAESPFNFFVREDSKIGNFVGQVFATDVDTGLFGRVRYQLLDAPDSLFNLDAVTGIITLAKELDHEAISFYKMQVRAYDGGGKDNFETVFVFIEDVNDNPPRFLEDDEQEIGVSEGTDVGTVLYRFKFEDPDVVNFFNFKIDSTTDAFDQFYVDDDGKLVLQKPLDRERIASYKLRIVLRDALPPFHTNMAETMLTLIVTDVNDCSPVFESPNVMFVPESSYVGAIVGTVAATDADSDERNNLIQYSILPSSNPFNVFVIDAVLGYIIVNKPIDFEKHSEYNLIVVATDNGVDRLSTNQYLSIRVLDEDDNAPKFVDGNATVTVEDEAELGQFVTQMRIHDADVGLNAAVIFHLVEIAEPAFFKINAYSGIVTVANRLTSIPVDEVTLNVSARSFSGEFEPIYSVLTVKIMRTSLSELRFLDGEQMTIEVYENLHGIYPRPLHIFSLLGNSSAATFVLANGNTSIFAMNPSYGELLLNVPLDYETNQVHQLTIKAVSVANPLLSESLLVTVIVHDENDNSPVFSQPYYQVAISENNEPGLELISVNATDNDSGANGQVRYSLVNVHRVPFSIDNETGLLTVTESLDYEYNKEYWLDVRATDGGALLEHFSTVRVHVRVLDKNDNAPVIRNVKQDNLISADSRKGSIVFALDVFDPDENDELKFALNGPDQQYFVVDKRGIIRSKNSLGTQSEYAVYVIVTDAKGDDASTLLTFYTAPASKFPVFKSVSDQFTFLENTKDVEVATFVASSVDGLQCIRYSIANGNSDNRFGLDPFSGRLVVRELDYETVREHHLLIAATDCLNPAHTTFLPIVIHVKDVNDNAPMFDKVVYETAMLENQEPTSKPIVQVKAVDPDSGLNGKVRYRFLSGNDDGFFDIDPDSGVVMLMKPLDREMRELWELFVEARDGGEPSLTSIAIVKVIVKDENDNAPKFSRLLKMSVKENSAVGTVVGRVEVTDADSVALSNHSFSLETSAQRHFSIDPLLGTLFVEQPLDREKQSEYKLKVFVQDDFWRVSATITVNVEDENDNPPVFSLPVYTFRVHPDNATSGHVFGQATATDADVGRNQELFYWMDSAYFYVEPKTGLLMLAQNFSSAKQSEFSATVYAVDRGTPTLFSSAIVLVKILTLSLTPPKFSERHYDFVVPAGLNGTVEVGTVSITGADNVAYELHSDQGVLSVNPVTGAVAGDFSDFELGDSINAEVLAVGDGHGKKADLASVNIHIATLDDFKFLMENYTFSVSELADVNFTVGFVKTNSRFATYSILTDDDSFFGIDSKSGRLFIRRQLDFDTVPPTELIEFTVVAKISGWTSTSLHADVHVRVIDENDNAPIFDPAEIIVLTSGPIYAGATVFTAEAFDFDGPQFNTVFYMVDGSSEYFEVDTKSGEVFAMTNLEFVLTDSYTVNVKAINLNSTMQSVLSASVQQVSPPHNTATFARKTVDYSINRRAKISTIVGELNAHSIFDEPRYFAAQNEWFKVDAVDGTVSLINKLNDNVSMPLTAIVKSGRLNRVPPSVCEAEIGVTELAPPPVFPEKVYEVKLDSTTPVLSEVLKFNFVLPTDVEMSVRGLENDVFCFDKRGVLMTCHEIDRDEFHLTMIIAANGSLRSKADLRVRVKRDLSLPIFDHAIAHVPENVNRTLQLMRLPARSPDAPTSFWITDPQMNSVFSINASTGVVSSKQAFDRELRSFYSVPIQMQSKKSINNVTVHVFVDDEDDNAISEQPLNVAIFSPKPLFSGLVPGAFPADLDEVFGEHCIPASANRCAQIVSNCSLVTEDLPIGKLRIDAKYGALSTPYSIEITHWLTTEEIVAESIKVTIFGSKRAIADFLQKLQETIPDMSIYLAAADCSKNMTCRLSLAVLTASGSVIPAIESVRIVDNFAHKKAKALNVLYQGSSADMCGGNSVCKGRCRVLSRLNSEWEAFRSVNWLWMAPVTSSVMHCVDLSVHEDILFLDSMDESCGSDRCVYGTCLNGTTCICNENYFGQTCEHRIFSFGQNSQLLYTAEKTVNLSFQILTKEPHGVLFYSNIPEANSSVLVDYINGKPRISVNTRYEHFSATLKESINDGNWHEIAVNTHSTGTISLVTRRCDSEPCLPCRDESCHALVPAVSMERQIHFGSVIESGAPDMASIELSSTTLRACMKLVVIDGNSLPQLKETNVLMSCPLLMQNNLCESSEAQENCREGTCVPDWDDYKCICNDGFESTDCDSGKHTVGFNEGRVRLALSPFLRRQLQYTTSKAAKVRRLEDSLKFGDHNDEAISNTVPCLAVEMSETSKEKHLDDKVMQWLEIDVRTTDASAHIFTMSYGSQKAMLHIKNGSVLYGVYYLEQLVVEAIAEASVNDGNWHRLGVDVSADGKTVRLTVDGIGKELQSTISFPQLVFAALDYIDFGTTESGSFHGCLRRLVMNNQLQLLHDKMRALTRQFFHTQLMSESFTVRQGCDEEGLICGNAISNGDQASGCSMVSVGSRIPFSLLASICTVIVFIFVFLTLTLLHIIKVRRKQRLAKQAQRISNLQLVSTTEDGSTYKHASYDEFIASVLARNRLCSPGHDNRAYFNQSLDSHIYDNASTEAIEDTSSRSTSSSLRPIPKPRHFLEESVDVPLDSASGNAIKSRFFRPSAEHGLVAVGNGPSINLNVFHHESERVITGQQMSQRM